MKRTKPIEYMVKVKKPGQFEKYVKVYGLSGRHFEHFIGMMKALGYQITEQGSLVEHWRQIKGVAPDRKIAVCVVERLKGVTTWV